MLQTTEVKRHCVVSEVTSSPFSLAVKADTGSGNCHACSRPITKPHYSGIVTPSKFSKRAREKKKLPASLFWELQKKKKVVLSYTTYT